MNTQMPEQTKRSLLLEPIKRLCTAEQFGAIGKLLDFEIKIAKSHWIAEVRREVEGMDSPFNANVSDIANAADRGWTQAKIDILRANSLKQD